MQPENSDDAEIPRPSTRDLAQPMLWALTQRCPLKTILPPEMRNIANVIVCGLSTPHFSVMEVRESKR
jgi:hypothetical protein